MSNKKSATTKFKIYKIKNEYSIDGIFYDIESELTNKQITYDIINKNDYKGLIFSTISQPQWINCIHELVDKNLKNKYQENNNLSYVLFKKSSNNNIYAISGGQGYHYLKGYYEKNYGLNLIPKLINNTDNVVRTIIEKRLYTNQIYDHRINRNTTNLNYEYDFTNLYKELELILTKEILSELNFIDNEYFKDLEYITISNKDYVFIEKKFTWNNLEYILNWIDSINERPLNFELNSFIAISGTENYKPSEMIDILISHILKEDQGNYDLILK